MCATVPHRCDCACQLKLRQSVSALVCIQLLLLPFAIFSRVNSHRKSQFDIPTLVMDSKLSKSHVLAGVQDAYWSDDEGVSGPSELSTLSSCQSYAGGCRMSTLLRGNGFVGHGVQAMSLWIPGKGDLSEASRAKRVTSDLPFLLAPHQGKLEWAVPSMQKGVHRRGCPVQGSKSRRVSISNCGVQPLTLLSFSVRRINQQKKTKEKERKELEALGRRHLTNVRVVQKNVVYIIGVGPRFAREEAGGLL